MPACSRWCTLLQASTEFPASGTSPSSAPTGAAAATVAEAEAGWTQSATWETSTVSRFSESAVLLCVGGWVFYLE